MKWESDKRKKFRERMERSNEKHFYSMVVSETIAALAQCNKVVTKYFNANVGFEIKNYFTTLSNIMFRLFYNLNQQII